MGVDIYPQSGVCKENLLEDMKFNLRSEKHKARKWNIEILYCKKDSSKMVQAKNPHVLMPKGKK